MQVALLMGGAWSFTDRNWAAFLREWKRTKEVPILTSYAKFISDTAVNITDWSDEDAVEALSELDAKKRLKVTTDPYT